jgi:hypothetical protein
MGILNVSKPTVFRNFDNDVPSWNFFISHANYSRNKGGDSIRVFDSYYFVVEVFDEDLKRISGEFENFYNKINKNHKDGIQPRPVLLISYFDKINNLGKHKDGYDQLFWNCIGNTVWQFENDDGTIERYILNPGDLIVIPVNTYHQVLSVTPRAGITFSSNPVVDN